MSVSARLQPEIIEATGLSATRGLNIASFVPGLERGSIDIKALVMNQLIPDKLAPLGAVRHSALEATLVDRRPPRPLAG